MSRSVPSSVRLRVSLWKWFQKPFLWFLERLTDLPSVKPTQRTRTSRPNACLHISTMSLESNPSSRSSCSLATGLGLGLRGLGFGFRVWGLGALAASPPVWGFLGSGSRVWGFVCGFQDLDGRFSRKSKSTVKPGMSKHPQRCG